MRKISKILIANRGEIAVRVIRAAREMDIHAVAIYSGADRHSPHVRWADEAYGLADSEMLIPYLDMDEILRICKRAKVDAVHPGYGFLSENADFAHRLQEEGIEFIGPTPDAIRLMGSKIAAKDHARKSGVRVIPGSKAGLNTAHEAAQLAGELGFPVLLKAAAGGGGKGMRIVRSGKELSEQFRRARSEAFEAFGDGSLFLEKLIEGPKHIEIQVFGDKFGNFVHLYERDCSVQRRYQKVVEEAPSTILTPSLREEMGEAAIKIAKSCGYISAGTVEFMVDNQSDFYFMEMNTRLQVEHPVTELITGIDLVKEQIRIAEGHPLSFSQEGIPIHGHAIELRIYAEDPHNNFLPDPGILLDYSVPRGPGVRVDDGYESGLRVPVDYDPLIAKLIVHGIDREEAIQRMKRAIREYRINGVRNTLHFGYLVLDHEQFVSGDYTTHFINDHFLSHEKVSLEDSDAMTVAAALAAKLFHQGHKNNLPYSSSVNTLSKWKNRR